MLKIYLVAGACAAIFAAGIAADRMAPVIGANARIGHFKSVAVAWKTNAEVWRAYGEAEAFSFRKSEAYRRQERATAVRAVDETSRACGARVARARASAAAIHTLVTKEPKHDAQGCPGRELVGADELRNAIDPAGR